MTIHQTPNAQIRAGEQTLEAAGLHALSRIRVQQALSLPAQCELLFTNPTNLGELLETFASGTELRVAASPLGDWIFDGEVTVTEQHYGPAGQMELRVRGYDRLHRLRKRQARRVFQNVRLADLASELCSETGAALFVSTSIDDPVLAELVQSGQSDFDFLRQVTDRRGLYFTLYEEGLEILSLEGSGEPVTLELGQSLFEARIETSAEIASPAVQAAGWSPYTAEVYTGEASPAPAGEPPAGSNGAAPAPAENPREVWNSIAFDAAYAASVAQGELARRAARSRYAWGVAEGNPALRPGAVIEISGVDASARGSYTVTSATHIITSARGYQTEFSSLPPAPPAAETAAGMTLGIIVDVDDPQGLGRVRAEMPSFGGYESGWMHVVLPAAGANKGLMSLPAPGDTVLILFPLGEPAQGFILGGLYGMQGMPDSGVDGGAVKRYTLLTPDGQRLTLDDAGRKIRVEDSTGSFVELSPERAVLHAAVDLLLEAPGKRVVVRGQNIDFERG